MLPKKNRNTKTSFTEALQAGKSLTNQHISLRYTFIPKDIPTFSFVVPKAVSKSAISRNTLRRKGYSAIESYVGALPPVKALFFFKKGAEKLTFLEIQGEIKQLLTSARLLK